MKRVWSPTLAWFLAVVAAVLLAVAAPTESSVMGRLPSFHARQLDQKPLVLPEGLGADRTLAFISFHRDQRPAVDSWIHGLQLSGDASVRWLRMLVVNDPGDDAERSVIENRLRERYAQEKAAVVPVFTDRNAFARSTGLSGVEQPHVVVLNRRGEVLARVEGPFNPEKARTLRATLDDQ
jgi:hypothetical protein